MVTKLLSRLFGAGNSRVKDLGNMPYIDPRYNPFYWIPQVIGATIYWLLFSWHRRSLLAEIKCTDHQLWHGLIAAGLLFATVLALGIQNDLKHSE